jgi:hypothetical protein
LRISAVIVYFAPSLGLFDLLMHWKMGQLEIAHGDLPYDALANGTIVRLHQVWQPIQSFQDLTFLSLKHYYFIFIGMVLTHFLLVALIKLAFAREFRSKRNKCEKMFHILHQSKLSQFIVYI